MKSFTKVIITNKVKDLLAVLYSAPNLTVSGIIDAPNIPPTPITPPELISAIYSLCILGIRKPKYIAEGITKNATANTNHH